MRVSVEVSGDREAERSLRRIAARASTTQPAFVQMLGDLEDAERSFFGAHGAGHWPAMSEKTKARHGEHELMDLTGKLLRSLTERHGPYAVREARNGEARFGTWDPVAHLQAGGHGAPKRAVLAPLSKSRTRLAERLRRHIIEQAR